MLYGFHISLVKSVTAQLKDSDMMDPGNCVRWRLCVQRCFVLDITGNPVLKSGRAGLKSSNPQSQTDLYTRRSLCVLTLLFNRVVRNYGDVRLCSATAAKQ